MKIVKTYEEFNKQKYLKKFRNKNLTPPTPFSDNSNDLYNEEDWGELDPG